jgi:hypothetical protein
MVFAAAVNALPGFADRTIFCVQMVKVKGGSTHYRARTASYVRNVLSGVERERLPVRSAL